MQGGSQGRGSPASTGKRVVKVNPTTTPGAGSTSGPARVNQQGIRRIHVAIEPAPQLRDFIRVLTADRGIARQANDRGQHAGAFANTPQG